ncbi:MAG TPA: O-antigen ligase family protein [Bacteroidia bacterium]|nr:O-antigen ligase family protein [Bacteroidia bacterium]
MKLKSLTITDLIFIFLFGMMPFLYLPITQDPELSLRYFVFSLLLTGTGLFLLKKPFLYQLKPLQTPVVIAFGSYSFFSGLSLIHTLNTGDGIYEFTKIMLGLFFLLLLLLLSQKHQSPLLKIPGYLTFSCLVFSVFGITQLLPIVIDSLQNGTPFTVLNNVSSTLSNKNFFAETLLMLFPFVVYTMLTHTGWIRWISAVSMFISFLLIVIIQSASVYIAFIFAFLVTGILLITFRKYFIHSQISKIYKTRTIAITIISIVVIPVALIALFPEKIDYHQLSKKWKAANDYLREPEKIFEKDNQKNNNSLYDRLFLARNSFKMIQEHPLAGNGLANWKILYPKYGLYGNSFMSTGRLRFEHPHNDYLFILCESGIAGLLSWLLFLSLIIYYAIKNIKENENEKIKLLMIFIISAVVSFAVTGLFGYPKERFFTMMILISASILVVSFRTVNSKNQEFKSTGIVTSLLLLLIPIAWIQFQRYQSEIYLQSAFIFQKKSNFGGMQRMLKKAENPFHAVDLTATPLSWHIGQSYYYQGNHQKAFEQYLLASRVNPYHMQVWNDLGALYEEQKNHAKALECFNRVFAMNPDFPDAKMNMVAYYFNTGEVDKAYDILKNHLYKFTAKWRDDMKIILMAKAEKYVQVHQDSTLAALLNKRLASNPNYFLGVFAEAEKDSITFEASLARLK